MVKTQSIPRFRFACRKCGPLYTTDRPGIARQVRSVLPEAHRECGPVTENGKAVSPRSARE